MILLFLFISFSSFTAVPNYLIVKVKKEYAKKLEAKLNGKWEGQVWSEYLLKFGFPEVDTILQKNSINEIRKLILGKLINNDLKAKKFGLDRYYLLIFSKPVNINSLTKELINSGYFEVVEPDEMRKVSRVPNDPMYGDDYWTKTWYLPKICAPLAWNIGTGSSNTVVGPIDTGVDWHHEDIFFNLWVNPGEDLNRNGIFDYPSDFNGIDDDGDGYIDDIIGFDFYSNDWDPSPNEQGNQHGTHVFGLAAGVTNNGTGIASISWNIKGMAFKCGNSQYIYTSSAVNAVYFAVSHGAVATNHSYGGYYYRSSEADVIAYAHANDVSIIAAAGNDSTSLNHYPSAYPNVIGVAATDQGDNKASFSNYGDFIDVCTPGVNILSTIPGNNYARFNGTSMASPIVCGLIGLLRSLHPEYGSFESDSAVMWGCDDIRLSNPDSLRGKLGWGRVNAFNTIALTFYPNIIVDSVYFNERPDTGSILNTLFVDFVYNKKHWKDASGVYLTFTSNDDGIEFEDSIITIGDISAGDTIRVMGDSVSFRAYGIPRYVDIIVTPHSTDDNPYDSDTFKIIIGKPKILLINDDVDSSRESFYTQVLDMLNLNFEITRGPVFGDELSGRDLVIWYTGDNEFPDTSLISPIEQFLNDGGNLFISSQYLADNRAFSDFIAEYVKTNVSDTGRRFRGIKGNGIAPWFNNFYRLYGTGSAANVVSADLLNPVGSAYACLYYTSPVGSGNFGNAAVAYEGGYKTLFFGFPFEAVSMIDSGRINLFETVLTYFGINLNVFEFGGGSRDIKILHNLTGDRIKFVGQIQGDEMVKIYDVAGKLEMQERLKSDGIISLKKLRDGVYFIELINHEKQVFKNKILKIQGRR